MQFHIVLHQPRIPQNTGNIGRLCFASITLEHFYLTTKSTLAYYKADLKNGAYLHFGREDAGLNPSLLAQYPKQTLTIPMQNNARSLNLATSVGIVLYEGIRQRDLFHL